MLRTLARRLISHNNISNSSELLATILRSAAVDTASCGFPDLASDSSSPLYSSSSSPRNVNRMLAEFFQQQQQQQQQEEQGQQQQHHHHQREQGNYSLVAAAAQHISSSGYSSLLFLPLEESFETAAALLRHSPLIWLQQQHTQHQKEQEKLFLSYCSDVRSAVDLLIENGRKFWLLNSSSLSWTHVDAVCSLVEALCSLRSPALNETYESSFSRGAVNDLPLAALVPSPRFLVNKTNNKSNKIINNNNNNKFSMGNYSSTAALISATDVTWLLRALVDVLSTSPATFSDNALAKVISSQAALTHVFVSANSSRSSSSSLSSLSLSSSSSSSAFSFRSITTPTVDAEAVFQEMVSPLLTQSLNEILKRNEKKRINLPAIRMLRSVALLRRTRRSIASSSSSSSSFSSSSSSSSSSSALTQTLLNYNFDLLDGGTDASFLDRNRGALAPWIKNRNQFQLNQQQQQQSGQQRLKNSKRFVSVPIDEILFRCLVAPQLSPSSSSYSSSSSSARLQTNHIISSTISESAVIAQFCFSFLPHAKWVKRLVKESCDAFACASSSSSSSSSSAKSVSAAALSASLNPIAVVGLFNCLSFYHHHDEDFSDKSELSFSSSSSSSSSSPVEVLCDVSSALVPSLALFSASSSSSSGELLVLVEALSSVSLFVLIRALGRFLQLYGSADADADYDHSDHDHHYNAASSTHESLKQLHEQLELCCCGASSSLSVTTNSTLATTTTTSSSSSSPASNQIAFELSLLRESCGGESEEFQQTHEHHQLQQQQQQSSVDDVVNDEAVALSSSVNDAIFRRAKFLRALLLISNMSLKQKSGATLNENEKNLVEKLGEDLTLLLLDNNNNNNSNRNSEKYDVNHNKNKTREMFPARELRLLYAELCGGDDGGGGAASTFQFQQHEELREAIEEAIEVAG